MTVHVCRVMSSICRAIVLSLFLSGPIAAWAYEETTVSNGGTVTGTVQFSGELPPPMPFELRRYPDPVYCGALSDGSGYRLLRTVAVGSQQGLKDVIVTVEGIEKGKPFEFTETQLEANVCQFVPFVSVMREMHLLTVRNLDPVSHDLQIYERDREHVFIMFHRPALTKSGTSDTIHFTGNRRSVIMQCGMHAFMQGHGLAVENPYYAITGFEGVFTIKDLPAGTYRIRAWHPTLGEKEQSVTVAANGIASLGFSFEAK
ncbi:MAG TPA: carboxypeptidase regulatory-like domain-containing protein [Nitrospiraceae bacterium]|nr:carboxypeptidase regulatory-like domain-containing protein [Nitrospiraceae bacterium]